MSFYKFTEDDLFTNTIEAYPEYSFYIVSSSVYINNIPNASGALTDNIFGVPDGFLSLYEYNIDRPSTYIYPFLYKDGLKNIFKSYNTGSYNIADYGTVITSSYRLSSSISRYYYDSTGVTGSSRTYLFPLKNTMNHYTYLSPRYAYSASFGDKDSDSVNLINIPSIFYGSSIKKGSVSLKYYISGSLVAELVDKNFNGDLIQVSSSTDANGEGRVAGTVLYNEGFIILTGSWNLNQHFPIGFNGGSRSHRWLNFAVGANDGAVGIYASAFPYTSFAIDYQGTTHTQTLTMFAHAKQGHLNYSNNPTYLKYNEPNYKNASTGSSVYGERPVPLHNNVDSSFTDVAPDFEKVTYISKVGIYDENKNLIGIAKVAVPIKKTIKNNYTFKLKLDI
jgi:hypothetical protein